MPDSVGQGVGATSRRYLVAIGARGNASEAVRACSRMADASNSGWHAVHIETPGRSGSSAKPGDGEAMALAARLGATVTTIPATSVVDGLISQVEEHGATDLVMSRPRGGRARLFRPSLAVQLLKQCPGLALHFIPDPIGRTPGPAAPGDGQRETPNPRSYVLSLFLVAATGCAAALVASLFGSRGLDLFFLFPVITAAVRFGVRPGLLAVAASVIVHNVFLVRPLFALSLGSQSLFMLFGLAAVAIYTGMISERLRGRVRLSDRSAKENAAIITFAQELARAANWSETARIVCETLNHMLDVRAVLLREKGGELVVEAAYPTAPMFGPVDIIARDWTWKEGQESGHGTTSMAAADWQFLPLKTGLGVLAILAIARDNGTSPVPADRAVLLATLTALAALAHERLRLEDLAVARGGRRKRARDPGSALP